MKSYIKYAILFLSTASSLVAMEKVQSFEELRREVEELKRQLKDRHDAQRGKFEDVQLISAAAEGFDALIDGLLDEGAQIDAHLISLDPRDDGNTALIAAAQAGKAGIVKLLVKRGANVHASNGRGLTALMEADAAGYKDIVDFLVANGAHDTKSQKELNNRLLEACTQSELDEVASLLRKGAAPNARSEHDWKLSLLPGGHITHGGQSTPLSRAAQFGHFTHPESVQNEIVRLLLSKGALVNAVNLDGSTVLIEAAGRARGEMVKMLLTAGADVNMLNNSRRSALSYATPQGCTEIVRDLLHHGASRNLRFVRGMSPIVQASYLGREELVRVLVEHDEPFREHELELAALTAMNAGHQQIAEYLGRDHTIRKG